MRRLEVLLRPTAQNDLNDIYQYIVRRTRSFSVAEGYIGRLLSAVERIGDGPEGGRPRDDLEPGLRTWAFERRIIIAYKVTENAVEITSILYGGRSIEVLYKPSENMSYLR
jgi:toxin ParE1/3/4